MERAVLNWNIWGRDNLQPKKQKGKLGFKTFSAKNTGKRSLSLLTVLCSYHVQFIYKYAFQTRGIAQRVQFENLIICKDHCYKIEELHPAADLINK